MTNAQFDHFITAANTPNIDNYLQEYENAGFLVADRTVRHDPGLRNGFVRFGPEYLEFVWVEDEKLFEEGAETAIFPQVRDLRAAFRPFGIGIDAADVRALREEWARRGYELPPVTDGVARDTPPGTPPIWSFLPIPLAVLRGAMTFALTYHTRPKDAPRRVQAAANTTYAIQGVTFTTDEPEVRAKQWRDLLAPDAEVLSKGGYHGAFEVWIGPHLATWITPEHYQEDYGLSYKASPHPFGEIAVIHLLATDLDKAEETIGAARQATRIPDKLTGADTLLVPPDARDGFTFAVTGRPIEEWIRWREGVTGDKIELA
jgi:hypothetical protein